MGNVIEVNFRAKLQDLPEEYSSVWLSTDIKPMFLKKNSIALDITHIRFKVYRTSRNIAIQFHYGIGKPGSEIPSQIYQKLPIYRKSIKDTWKIIFDELEMYNAVLPCSISTLRKSVK